jgi:BirA family biotin operon repressor/biotin-[acetyl-CoA-carboxylase] ligase
LWNTAATYRSRVLTYRIDRLVSTTSTNTVALDAAAAGEAEGYVVIADHQTAGRGRLGRAWVAPPGTALLVSVLLRPPPADAHLAVSALSSAATAACERTAAVSPALKWPNDLVAGDRKLGGVLAETMGNLTAVVVGLGLNVHVPTGRPGDVAAIAVDLDDLAGRRVPRGDLLDALLIELARRYDDLGSVMAEYRSRCATIGQQVRVTLLGGSVTGTAVGVADDGSLLVDDGGPSPVVVTAGDVTHVRPAAG